MHNSKSPTTPTRWKRDTAMGERYNYRLLQNERSIRLLRLTPTSLSSPLHCDLFDVDLERCPYFEALSYVWGRMTPGRHILSGGSQLPITENCEAALRCLRRRGRPRVLWVDAICINQSSNEQKSVQVALMGRIYGQAARVLAWLGNSSEMGAVAFKHLSRLGMASRSGMAMRLLSPALLRRLHLASGKCSSRPRGQGGECFNTHEYAMDANMNTLLQNGSMDHRNTCRTWLQV